MTVSSEVNRSGPYNGNGVTTIFDYDWRIVNKSHLSVIKRGANGVETTLTVDVDYEVSDVGEADGGQIAVYVAPAAGETITIIPNVPFTQEIDLENQGAYYAETIERGLDLAAMRDQQLQEGLSRAVKYRASSALSGELELPDPAPGGLLGWNNEGTGIENRDGGTLGLLIVGKDVQAYSDTLSSLAGSKHLAFPARADAGLASIPNAITSIRTNGYLSEGDGGGALFYLKAGIEADMPGDLLTNGGTKRWGIVTKGQAVFVEMLGGRGYDHNTLTTDMIDSAQAFRDAFALVGRGGNVHLRNAWYRVTKGFTMPEGSGLIGAAASGAGGPKFYGTVIIADGAGPKDHQFKVAISQSENSGGVVANPSAAFSYASSSGTALNNFRLADFTNQNAPSANANPATARAFSAVIKQGRFCRLANLTITNDFNGNIRNHHDLFGLGDAWDVGIYAPNSDNWWHNNVHVYGNFRDAGFLLASTWLGEDDIEQTGFNGSPIANQGTAFDCTYAGHVGFMVRSADTYRVTAITTTYVEIPWDKSHMFPATGSLVLAGTKALKTYTAVTKVGDKLRFTMSSDPTGSFVVGDAIKDGRDVGPWGNYGYDGTRFWSCRFQSLIARSYLSTDVAYGFNHAGCAVQMSGFPIRGFDFYGCTFMLSEDVMLHLHRAADIGFHGCYFEGQGAAKSTDGSAIAAGAYFIGLWDTFNTSLYPSGGTGNVYFTGKSQWAFRTITRLGGYTQTSDASTRHNGIATGLFNPDQLTDDTRNIIGTLAFGGTVRYRGGAYSLVDNDSGIGATRMSIDVNGNFGFGNTPNSAYRARFQGSIEVTSNVKAATVTADSFVFPQVTTTQLTSIADPINTTGKVLGKIVFNTTTGLYMRSNGSAAGSTWRDLMNTATITPV